MTRRPSLQSQKSWQRVGLVDGRGKGCGPDPSLMNHLQREAAN
jgi:hypothetical protein